MSKEKSIDYVYAHGRDIEKARMKYLFEDGSYQEVLDELVKYQNEDGGFGHGLEIDCWNPNSSPIQTWKATEILKELNMDDKNHPIIQGILKYFTSQKDFDGHLWANVIKSNNNFPHAPWWHYNDSIEPSYNPTVSFVGFIIRYSEPNSDLYNLGTRLYKEVMDYLRDNYFLDSMHTVSCYVELYEYLKDILDMSELKSILDKQIDYIITKDKSIWSIEYVCKPSLFISSKNSDFYLDNQDICQFECEFIKSSQETDGTWAVTWSWNSYLEQWQQAKIWWQCDIIINNLKYLKNIA